MKAWRLLEKMRIESDQRLSDHARKNQNLPKQMLTSFSQAEKIKLEDNFFNETGFEVHNLVVWMEENQMNDDERFKVISADEYKKHAESLRAKTAKLIDQISKIEKELEKE